MLDAYYPAPELLERLKASCGAVAGLQLAYAYGSRFGGWAHERSDIDLGLLVPEGQEDAARKGVLAAVRSSAGATTPSDGRTYLDGIEIDVHVFTLNNVASEIAESPAVIALRLAARVTLAGDPADVYPHWLLAHARNHSVDQLHAQLWAEMAQRDLTQVARVLEGSSAAFLCSALQRAIANAVRATAAGAGRKLRSSDNELLAELILTLPTPDQELVARLCSPEEPPLALPGPGLSPQEYTRLLDERVRVYEQRFWDRFTREDLVRLHALVRTRLDALAP